MRKGGLDPVNTYTCLKTGSCFFGGDVLFHNWHNHGFHLIYDPHKKLYKISFTAVVRRKIQFGLCVDLTVCQHSYLYHLRLHLKG